MVETNQAGELRLPLPRSPSSRPGLCHGGVRGLNSADGQMKSSPHLPGLNL